MQLVKPFARCEQWPFGIPFAGLLLAALPQLLYRGVQEYGRNSGRLQPCRVSRLHEGTTSQGDDFRGSIPRFLKSLSQRSMLGPPESRLSGMTENLCHGAALVQFDAIVQILESPIQPPRQHPAHGAFARTHIADQKYRTAGDLRGRSRTLSRARGFARTPFHPLRFSVRCYFPWRFLRWILPLKVRNTTVEDMAACPIVPAKARPSLMGNQVCAMG